MHPGPSEIIERLVALFIPPVCREEILGDLHERFTSALQYAVDAFRTVPLVIISQMRRTADPQLLVIQGFSLYASFLAAAWFGATGLVREQRGLVRFAIPTVMAVVGLTLSDTYTSAAGHQALKLACGPLAGLFMVLASQGILWITNPALRLPVRVIFYGCAMGLLLSSGIRVLFPPVKRQRR
jgi:hypothetical protein